MILPASENSKKITTLNVGWERHYASGLSKNRGLGEPIQSLAQYVPKLYLSLVLH